MRRTLLTLILLANVILLSSQTNYRQLIQDYRYELQQEGDLSGAEIEKMVNDYSRVLGRMMLQARRNKNTFIIPLTREMRNNPANCKNGGFEDANSFDNWSFFTGCNFGGYPIGSGISTTPDNDCCVPLPLGIQGTSISTCGHLHNVHISGNWDQTLDNANPPYNMPVVPIGGGNRSVVLGNDRAKRAVEGIRRTITLDNSNPTISFKYAVVMDSSHSNPDGSIRGSEVFFLARVIDVSNNAEIARYEEVGNPNNSFIQRTNNSTTYFRDWECVTLHINSIHAGKTVSVEFINSDCSLGAHRGYTYLDDFCVPCNGSSSGGSINITRVDSCIVANSQIAGNFVLPAIGGSVGTLNSIELLVFQNGDQAGAINNPTILGNSYVFNISPVDFPGGASPQCYDLIAKATFSLVNPYSGQTSTITGVSAPIALGEGVEPGENNDVCVCPETGCCPGKNLVQNPFFELGNNNFSSSYTYESVAAPNSVMPGEYSVVSGAQAAVISPQWNISNPETCDDFHSFMVVNGKTGQAAQAVIWEQTITGLASNTPYRFCVQMKNLAQCAFDVAPTVEVQFSSGGGPITQTISTGGGACDWELLSATITPNSTTLNIKILLDETPLGDGNDLAIDAVSLYETPPLAQTYRDFTYAVLSMDATTQTYSIQATPVAPLPDGCEYFWEVCETSCPGSCVDCNSGECVPGTKVSNPSQWWTGGTTDFAGYNGTSTLSGTAPGVFQYGKRYMIKRGVYCDCNAWSESRWCFEYDPGARRVVGRRMGPEGLIEGSER